VLPGLTPTNDMVRYSHLWLVHLGSLKLLLQLFTVADGPVEMRLSHNADSSELLHFKKASHYFRKAETIPK